MKFLRDPDETNYYLPEQVHIANMTWKIRGRDLLMFVVVGGGHEAKAYTDQPGCSPFVFSPTLDVYTHVRIILRDSQWQFYRPSRLSAELAFLDCYWRRYENGFQVPIAAVDTLLRVLEPSDPRTDDPARRAV